MIEISDCYTIPQWNTRYRFADLPKKPKFLDHYLTTTLRDESWQK
jgi:hypothetical protein